MQSHSLVLTSLLQVDTFRVQEHIYNYSNDSATKHNYSSDGSIYLLLYLTLLLLFDTYVLLYKDSAAYSTLYIVVHTKPFIRNLPSLIILGKKQVMVLGALLNIHKVTSNHLIISKKVI